MLVSATKTFTDAIRAGNIAKAKQQYVIAHPYFEQGEPIMDKFDDLEKSIDLRPDNGTDITTVTGFHRLEKALWGDNSADGMAQIATKLDTDIATLRGNLQQAQFTAADFVHGAAGLLKEVADRNTGEDEDAFSHTDLYDIAGNIAGVEKGFGLLEPAIAAKDSALASDVKQKLATVDSTLAKFKQGNGYPDFTTVGATDRKAIGTAIGDAAQALGKVSNTLT
jgi:iron uptake system component EfeO